ncbi:glutathione S-transferase N-terminal domain-containing protein [Moraxella bovis]|uniref:Glutathione S-transferase N-terminal domain-containing protein n=2 Tax=Moraxella TaxID=475 RepID=A0A1T0AAE0_MORBO|nr:glutathione S-transferase N-terminal domain-containing protein [Moraxella bovis]AWY20748.1 starvation protein A [Moraxella bovis]OOR92609.1 starvation protein A [Moraxella bovis]UYZ69634.1 glutathione S-transferase N-terminal domain-containing protein [Moraxella bovis]UYZ72011.1 glutathione S-transferase N-terminal domain-containing protein [Moraxella bovis]UYZ74421.1 glutathione S-transferase N-terminal domain-containing protein [Moraxella bovis]
MADFSHLLPTQFLLYGDDGYDSHVVRFLLEEKGVNHQFAYLPDERPEYLAELNPYNTLPVLVGRDLALYELMVIFEYLEERHGANKLLPPTPKERAKVRQLAWRLRQDWLSLGRILMTHPDSFNPAEATHAKKTLTDSLITLSPLFARHDYFMQDEFGLCDVLLLPLLHRLPMLGIHLPTKLCKPLLAYQARLSARVSFQKTLITPAVYSDDDF